MPINVKLFFFKIVISLNVRHVCAGVSVSVPACLCQCWRVCVSAGVSVSVLACLLKNITDYDIARKI